MLNRRLHKTVVGGILGIVICSMTGAWLLIGRISIFLAFVCAAVIIALAFMLVRKMEKADRQLAGFFRAIKQNDFNVHYTEKNNNPYMKELFEEMNRIMMQFEDNRIEMEERRHFYESIVRVLTHEIRNSITPIASLSADLIQHTDDYGHEGMIDGLQTIHQQALQLTTFLHRYHRLTNLPDPVLTKVNVRSLFGKLERLLSLEQGSKNIQYDSPENMELFLDPHLITLALINLIRNALQATVNQIEPQIKVEAQQEKLSSFIQVTDNGEGIPQERLKDVFIPFYSTRKDGSGIGLSVSRRIMQLHDGELMVNSDPGKKTIFSMSFPTHRPAPQ